MLTNKIIDTLCEKYGVVSTKCEVVDRLLFRKSFVVKDVLGNKYIIKAYSTKLNLEKLKSVWECYERLKKSAVITNNIIKPIDNSEDLFFTIDGNDYVIFSYIEGKLPSLDDVAKIADALRQYHKVSAKFLTLPMISSTKKDLEGARVALERFHDGGNKFGKEIVTLRERIFSLIDCCKMDNNIILIHGDLIIENTIRTLDGISLIDFDSIRYGYPVEDVANLLFSILYFGTNPFQIMMDREAYIKCFLNAYYQMDITENVINEIEYYMKIHCIVELARHLENFRFLIRAPGMSPYIELLLEIIRRDDLIKSYF